MKTIKKFLVGEAIPSDAVFLKVETVVEKKYSRYTWCGCPDLLDCNCYEKRSWDEFYYEVNMEDGNEIK